MKNMINDVREFMEKCGQPMPSHPEIPSFENRKLRIKLIAEELAELADSYGVSLDIFCDVDGKHYVSVEPKSDTVDKHDLKESIDADIDLLYVIIGDLVAKGINPLPFWDEIHRSNMTKFIDGYKREDGKWMKGKSYSPANLQPILDEQISQNGLNL